MSDEKILKFPEHRIVRDYPNSDFLKQAEERAADGFTLNVANVCIDEIIDIFEAYGLFPVTETATDLAFVSDTIESAIFRILGKEHPLHEQIRIVEDDDELERNVPDTGSES